MTILAGNNSRTLAFSEAIADAIGSYEAAIVLQQIHYYVEQGHSGRVFNGVRWIYNSYRTWCREFKLFKPGKVRQLINLLRQFELIRVEQLTKNQDDKNCFWYTIDYDRVDELLSQNSSQSDSNSYSTGCVSASTTPVESELGCVASENSSIYTKKTNQRIHPIEDSNTAADFCESEYDSHDFSDESEELNQDKETRFPDQLKQPVAHGVNLDRESQRVVAARDNNNLQLLELYGFELNRQLEKLAAKYSQKEIERSLEYLTECKEAGQEVQKEAGWLTECLKDEWWRDSFKSREEAAINDAFQRWGKKADNLDAFFASYRKFVKEGWILPMPFGTSSNKGGEVIAGYLRFDNNGVYVNWYDEEFQPEDKTIFRAMHWNEASQRYKEENQ
jgi:hypothetical protein